MTQNTAKKKTQTITLTEYMKRYGDDATASLFVLNRTAPRGRIAFSCVGDLGTPVPVLIEPTFIPVDLTLSVQRANLITNSVFRRLLSMGHLLIVDNASANELFINSERSRDEHKRLLGTSYIEDSIEVDIEEDEGSKTDGLGDHLEIDLGNDFLNSLVFRVTSPEESEDDLCNEFLRRSDTLTLAELESLVPHVSTRPELAKIVLETIEDQA